jgi:hypothetical protein
LSVFTHIREKAASTITPNNTLTVCDYNLKEALKLTFPDSIIKVMWFFYASSVLINKNVFPLSSLKLILAIPLIPANCIYAHQKLLPEKWMKISVKRSIWSN